MIHPHHHHHHACLPAGDPYNHTRRRSHCSRKNEKHPKSSKTSAGESRTSPSSTKLSWLVNILASCWSWLSSKWQQFQLQLLWLQFPQNGHQKVRLATWDSVLSACWHLLNRRYDQKQVSTMIIILMIKKTIAIESFIFHHQHHGDAIWAGPRGLFHGPRRRTFRLRECTPCRKLPQVWYDF